MATQRTPRIPVPQVTEFDLIQDPDRPGVNRYRAQGAAPVETAVRNPNVSPERLEQLRAARAAPSGAVPTSAAPAATAAPSKLRPSVADRISTTDWRASNYLKNGLPNNVGPQQPAPSTLRGKVGGLAERGMRAAARTAGAGGGVIELGMGYKNAAEKALGGADASDVSYEVGKGSSRALGAYGGGVAGAKLGAVAGLATGPLAPIVTPVTTLIGAAGGAYLGSEAGGGLFERGMSEAGLRPQDRAPAPTPAPTVAPANSGINPQGLTSAGRTLVDDPRRVDMDPGRASLGAMRDFSRELGAVPDQLPSGLRQGVVVRTLDANGRSVYSGANVRENPQFVDGVGRDVSTQGSMNVVQGLRGGAGGPQAAVSAPAQGVTGGVGGFRTSPGMSRTVEQQLRDAEVQAGSIDRRTREIGLRSLERLGRLELAQGQNETQLRGAEIQAGASRYGADRRLEGDLVQAEATTQAASLRGRQASAAAQVERQAVSQAWQMANGDRRVAARILDSMGFSGAKLLSSEASEQGLQVKNREDSEALLKSLSAGEDGKIDAARLARNQAVANDITGGQWSTMTPEERVQAQTKVTRAVKLLDGLNERRNAGFLKAIGFDQSEMNFASLPDMQGAVVDRLSVGRPGSVERGDYRIRTKAGEEFLVPASALDEGTKAMLQKDFGIKFKE